MWRLAAVCPALLLASIVFFAGGVETGARHPNGALGLGAVALTALAGVGAIRDPWRLGRSGRWLLFALLATVLASWWVSPSPRAGAVALLALPAFVLLPAAAARLVGGASGRRLAIAGWGLAMTLVAGRVLVAFLVERGAAIAEPLGDRHLLAIVLAAGLPVAAIGWRERGPYRWLAASAIIGGVAALAATRSLVGVLALGAASWFAWRRAERGRELLLGAGLLALGILVPNLETTLTGANVEGRARGSAVAADWNGALERPWLGWGPGSGAWTEAGFHAALPAPEPPAVGLGSLRSTPSILAFELGLPALALIVALAVAFARARASRIAAAEDRALAIAGGAALTAGCVGLLSGAWLGAAVAPLSVALAAGWQLAGEGRAANEAGVPDRILIAAYLVALLGLGRPLVAAHGAYERAQQEDDAGRRAELLATALRLDPEFPLYRAKAAWNGTGSPGAPAVRELVGAARAARGVGDLWLRAAVRAEQQGDRLTALRAAARAAALDPLSAAAPFLLHRLTPGDVDCAARALLAEPRLAASVRWRGRERLRRRVLERVGRWRGVDEGWRRQFLRQAVGAAPGEGPIHDLVIRVDETAATSISLRLFRRTPWPQEIVHLRVDRAAARRLRVPPASRLGSSSPDAFPPRRCAPQGEAD